MNFKDKLNTYLEEFSKKATKGKLKNEEVNYSTSIWCGQQEDTGITLLEQDLKDTVEKFPWLLDVTGFMASELMAISLQPLPWPYEQEVQWQSCGRIQGENRQISPELVGLEQQGMT